MAMNDPSRRPAPPREPRHDDGPPAIAVALVLGVIAIGCVVGYLLLTKLIEMKLNDDCMLHLRRCTPIEVRP
jgi:hypothetical protein